MLSARMFRSTLLLWLTVLIVLSEQPVHVSAASTFSICSQLGAVNNCPPSTSTVQASQMQGGSSTFLIIINNISGNPSVSLVIVNPPNGFTSPGQIQIGPVSNNAPYNATAIITSFGSTPPNPYLFIIQGVSGSETHQTSFIVTVTAGSFAITPTPSVRSIGAGDSADFSLSVAGVGGFSHTAFLTVNPPSTCTGCANNIAPAQNIPPFSATIRVYTSSSTGAGSYVFEVDGRIDNSTATGPIVYSAGVTVIVGAANFTVSATPVARNVTAGGQASFSVSVASVGSFNMPVSLTATVPSGFSGSISPSSNVPPYSATLLVGVPSTASAATYLATVTGSSGGSTYQTSVQLNVQLWNFTVSISPPSASISQGGSATFTVSVQKTNNFTGVVSLSASASASDINTTLLPSSGSPNFTSTMRVDVGFSVSPGTYIVLVQGTGGGVSKVALANVVVQAASWTIVVSPTTASIAQGGSGSFNISVTETGGFVGTVTLTVSAPSGLSTTLLPSSGTPDFMAVLRVQVSSNVSPGSYVVIVQGSDGHGGTAVATAKVNVGLTSFTVTATASSTSIYQTQSDTFTITVNPVGGFSSSVTLAATNSSGIDAQLGPTAGTPPFTATLIVSASTGTSPGSYVVTVGGSSGGQVAQTAVIVTILQKPPAYTIVISTQGLQQLATSNVYLDGVLQSQTVSDNASVTLGLFDGLSTHTVALDANVTLTSVEYLVNGASSVSVSNFVSMASQISVKFKYNEFWLVGFSASGLLSNAYLTLTVDGSSYYEFTPFTLQIWQQDGTQLSFSAPSQLQASGRIYGLVNWEDSSGKPVSSPVTVSGPITLTAYYAPTEWFLTVYDQQGANVTFSSNTQMVPASGYVVFAAVSGTYQLTTSEVILQSAGVGSHFKAWMVPTGSNNTETTLTVSVSLTSDLKVSVTRSLQYLLTLQSDYGTPQGGGWYDSGATASFSVNSPVPQGPGSQYACTGYNGDATGSVASGQIVMTGRKTIRFSWQVQYQLTVNTPYGSAQGVGWYNSGATATFNVSPPSDSGVRYTFQGWSGDYTGTAPSGSVLMNDPKSVTASWSREFQTTLVFVDAKDTPLTDTTSQVTLQSPSGSSTQFAANSSLWLDEGTWKVSSVILHGVEVSNGGSYNTLPNGKWTIRCQVYAMQVNVRGMLFAGSTSGVKVQLKLPDGTVISGVTDSSGQAELDGVPTGTYDIQASGLLSSGTIRADASNFTIVNIRMFAPVEIGGLAAVGGVAVAVAGLMLRARSKGPPKPVRQKQPPHEEQPSEAQETPEESSGDLVESESGEGGSSDDDLRVEA